MVEYSISFWFFKVETVLRYSWEKCQGEKKKNLKVIEACDIAFLKCYCQKIAASSSL